QRTCEQCMEPYKGSIIVLDPRSGDILALVSRPGFDPNAFAAGLSADQWNSINVNPDNPLLNRAIQFQAPPGSIFKVVTAVAGLHSGALSPGTTYFCNGAFKFSDHVYKCWNVYGHGTVDLAHALEGSCNVYFYQAGLKTGIDMITSTARNFCLGSHTGIELPNEKSGFIPDREWKMATFNDEWWPGETISVSIGQGGVTCTPIQIACLMAMTANRGILFKPKLVHSIIGHTARESRILDPEPIRKLSLPEPFWDTVIAGLREVIAGEHGTARTMKSLDFTIAGKTGTAQVISTKTLKQMGFESESETPSKFWDHNWFAGFAPVDKPEVVVVVVIENGGKHGAKQKAVIARDVFMKWYTIKQSESEVPADSGKETADSSERSSDSDHVIVASGESMGLHESTVSALERMGNGR
ncbi:hypothetical protein JXA80_05015, partial [bacterium]|nr:hypothetical protein [candidate division CSSED10-310 bacterium]